MEAQRIASNHNTSFPLDEILLNLYRLVYTGKIAFVCLKWVSDDIYSQWIDVIELIDIPQFYLSIKSSLGEKRKQEKTTKIEKELKTEIKPGSNS